jgi:copper chaperone NosL
MNRDGSKKEVSMKRFFAVSLFILLLNVFSAVAAEKVPPVPSPKAKCPVCGMFVAKYPYWTSSITFKDSSTLYFDGPKDLFKYYLNPGRYGLRGKQADVSAIHVKDYYSLAFIDGRQAYFVIGSDVSGPMGRELVPFAGKEDAEGFLKDHGGIKIVRFSEITAALLKTLE